MSDTYDFVGNDDNPYGPKKNGPNPYGDGPHRIEGKAWVLYRNPLANTEYLVSFNPVNHVWLPHIVHAHRFVDLPMAIEVSLWLRHRHNVKLVQEDIFWKTVLHNNCYRRLGTDKDGRKIIPKPLEGSFGWWRYSGSFFPEWASGSRFTKV
jgi:hypothetical protein